jgi:uncharacterized protein with beta-barrel porin domain
MGKGLRVNRVVSSWGVSTIALLWSGAALADPLDVTTALTNPVTSAAAANNSPGDITVESAGSVTVSTAGPAVTINSSNALTNGGTISTTAQSGATALLVDGTSPISTTITNNATISVTGTDSSGNVGTGNYGLRIANGPVTGTIASGTASAITVGGNNSFGVSIESQFTGNIALNAVTTSGTGSTAISLTAPLTGNLTLTGSSGSGGTGGIGLLVGRGMTGAIDNFGTVFSGTSSTTSSTGTATTTTGTTGTTTTTTGTGQVSSGLAGVWVASNVGGGIINDDYYTDSTGAIVDKASATSSDTLNRGAIIGYGGTTALLITPTSSNPTNIEISPAAATGTDDGYGIANRGVIRSEGDNLSIAATGISITGATINGTPYSVTIDNGISNQSGAAIVATSTDANATALDIGAGGHVPTFVNAGTVQTTVSTDLSGGNAYGIRIEAGGSLGSITNSDNIIASTAGKGFNAFAILDESGTLSTITNSGQISAGGGTGGTSRAIDLSAGSIAQTITNSGDIQGDILFGSGPASYISNSGSFTGTLAYGAGAGQLILNGTSDFEDPVTVASGGTLAVALSGTSLLRFGGTAPTLASLSATDQSVLTLDVTGATPALQVTGTASFTGNSSIRLNVLKPVGSQQITVLTAGGGIVTDHPDSLLGLTSAPFLYSLGGYSVDGGDLVVTLHQKSAAEIGFSPAIAPLFDQSLAAMANGGPEFQAIASLTDQASLLAAYRQIEPPTYGSATLRVAESLQDAGAGAIAARLEALALLPADKESKLGVWAQQGGEFLHQRDSEDDPGFKSSGFVLAFGADYRILPHLAAGIGAHFGWTNVNTDGESAFNSAPLSVHSYIGDAYLGWTGGPWFLQAIGSAGTNSYNFVRKISFGGYSATQTASWSGTQFSGSLIGGARFHFHRFFVQPSDAFTYLSVHQNKYDEQGGGAFDLAVNSQHSKMAVNAARLTAGYDFRMGGGGLTLAAHGAYLIRVDRKVSDVGAAFLSGGDDFDLTSAQLERRETEGGLTVAYHQQGFYLGVNGAQRQETGARDTSASLVVRATF